jgi:iron complex outermembrane receptor protein
VPTGFPAPLPAQADLIYRYAAATLKPERIVSSEIGYLGEFSSVKADLRLFRDEVSDMIGFYRNNVCNTVGGLTPAGVLCLGGNNFSMRNSGNAVIKGFEAQFDWRLGPDTRLLYGFSHAKVSSNDEDGTPYTASVPTNSQNLMVTHRFGSGWSGSLMGYQVGETKAIGGSLVNSYRRWDGRVAKQFKIGRSNAEAALIVQNLSNERSWEYDFDNQLPGRAAWANLRLEY